MFYLVRTPFRELIELQSLDGHLFEIMVCILLLAS